ncbi:hypothetical protein [Ruania albidiflava]|uniref:hypothetical protein n=2 Tax=Ruania albidiflava TaxID=366586 RepID=UPI0023F54A17|nr:hypothetical protein [Ruania albidiflava]
MASADDSLVGGLLDDAGDVVEQTTSVVAPSNEGSSAVDETDQSDQQPTSVVADVVTDATDGLSEVVEPVAETTEAVTEVVEPVAETTEAVTEVVEPVAETTEAVTEPVQRASDQDVGPPSGLTSLMAPVTEPLVDVVQPVTDGLGAPSLQQLSENVVDPVVGDVATPVLAPVLSDVITPVLAPVVNDVVAPVVQDVVVPIVDPVVTDITDSVVNPVIEQTLVPVNGERQGSVAAVIPVQPVVYSLSAVPDITAFGEDQSALATEESDHRSSAPSSALVPDPSVQGIGSIPEPATGGISPATDAPSEAPSNGGTGGDTTPEPAGSPTSVPSGAASAYGQGGAGFADIVREMQLPANAFTTQAAAESLPTVLDVILKVAVAPD